MLYKQNKNSNNNKIKTDWINLTYLIQLHIKILKSLKKERVMNGLLDTSKDE